MRFKRIYIEITNICNLNCSFCSTSNKKKKEMTPEEFKIILRKIDKYTDYIYLHVKGEPLTHHYLDEILSISKEYNKKVCITTNGVFLNDTSEISKDAVADKNQSFKYIKVTRGETLSEIAIKYNTSYKYLAKINSIPNPNLIYIGQKLKVPILDDHKIHDTSHRLYIVRKGNTLTQIAKEYGVSIESIVELNNIVNPNLIYIGETLRIPTINN